MGGLLPSLLPLLQSLSTRPAGETPSSSGVSWALVSPHSSSSPWQTCLSVRPPSSPHSSGKALSSSPALSLSTHSSSSCVQSPGSATKSPPQSTCLSTSSPSLSVSSSSSPETPRTSCATAETVANYLLP